MNTTLSTQRSRVRQVTLALLAGLLLLGTVVGNALAAPGDTTRVSVDSNGNQSNGSTGGRSAVSAEGRFVAFSSGASNLVVGDTNNRQDVFVRDRQTGTTERVNVDSAGNQANGDSGMLALSISADGRYVAFNSWATNLVEGDTIGLGGVSDVFVHDRQTDTTTRVSVDSNGNEANSSASVSSISADGRYVTLDSFATNLVEGDTNGVSDVFVRDRDTDANGVFDEVGAVSTKRISVGPKQPDGSEIQANGGSFAHSMSPDGRHVAFNSTASNLVEGDTGFIDIFVRDLQTGTTKRVSVDSSGNQAQGDSFAPSISEDGRYVAFTSLASNLVADDTLNSRDIFVRDLQTDTTELAGRTGIGSASPEDSFAPSISADGRYIAFKSVASDLVAGDTNNSTDFFVYDRETRTTKRVSVDSSGAQANSSSFGTASISADGRYISFASVATNLVEGDTNGVSDVFVHERSDVDTPPPPPPDTTPPDTTITSGPSGSVASASATFGFSSTEPGSTFQCALDSLSTYSPCTSPHSYSGLSEGSHTFYVKATDAAGNTDSTPATRNWIVDRTKPKVLGTTPLAGQTSVAPGTNVSATFSEKMRANSLRNATTLRSTTFTLVKRNANGTTTRVVAKVSYNAVAKKAVLNPDVNLVRGAKYVATVTTGAKDLAGNPLDQNRTLAGNQPKTWTFTTR